MQGGQTHSKDVRSSGVASGAVWRLLLGFHFSLWEGRELLSCKFRLQLEQIGIQGRVDLVMLPMTIKKAKERHLGEK